MQYNDLCVYHRVLLTSCICSTTSPSNKTENYSNWTLTATWRQFDVVSQIKIMLGKWKLLGTFIVNIHFVQPNCLPDKLTQLQTDRGAGRLICFVKYTCAGGSDESDSHRCLFGKGSLLLMALVFSRRDERCPVMLVVYNQRLPTSSPCQANVAANCMISLTKQTRCCMR